MAADATAPRHHYRPESLTLKRGHVLPLAERTLVMGVVNTTPDSFYSGSRTPDPAAAIARATALVEAGADIIDVGGESTRPGSATVSVAAELDRVLPVIELVRKASDIAISIDTRKAAVAAAALAAGADLVNDVSALTADEDMPRVVAEHDAVAILMHMRGTPQTMDSEARYDDVVLEVKAELGARVAAATREGIRSEKLWLDPGLGFAKTARHNLEILQRLDEFRVFEKPIVIGASRKSFIGKLLAEPDPRSRLEGSLAVAAVAALKGAHVIRTHDVAETRACVRVVDAIVDPSLTDA